MDGGSSSATAEYRRRNKLKSAFRVRQSLGAIYTGGSALLSADGLWLYATVGEEVLCTNTRTGAPVARFQGSPAEVTCLALTPTPVHHSGVLLVARRSLDLTFHATPDADSAVDADDAQQPIRVVARAHDAPIISASADPTGSLFATGSADGLVKCWSANGQCTHILKGHGGVVSAFGWDVAQAPERMRLFSGADDCRIRVWDLKKRTCEAVLEGHHAVVRGLAATDDGKVLVSGARDKVVNVWSVAPGTTTKPQLRSTIPVLETIEACGLVRRESAPKDKGKGKANEDDLLIYTGGDAGLVKLWSFATGKLVATEPRGAGKAPEIVSMQALPGSSNDNNNPTLVSVRVDQNILSHDVPTLEPVRHLIGFNDEVIDLALLHEDRLAAATNSEQIRVYDMAEHAEDAFSNTALLSGHTDVVLCLAATQDGSLLLSGSKDRSLRFWMPLRSAAAKSAWTCVGVATGHLESVGAVALSKLWSPREKSGHAFAASASQDCTVKLWNLAALNEATGRPEEAALPIPALCTSKIHDKDINSLDIAPNDKLLLSGSQDKTAKLFHIRLDPRQRDQASLKQLGVFHGHKRGVWCAKFSPHDQVVATASGDKTVKLWSTESFACLKTFEGHTNSVLRVDFLTKGLQLASCASDGLVKIWNVKDEETATTLDNHEEKVWALAVSKDEKKLFSGGADSVITVWEDVTQEQEELRENQAEELVLKNQDYENFVASQDYRSAILLALSLDQPRRLYNLFASVMGDRQDATSLTGSKAVDQALRSLPATDLLRLLTHVRDWNTSIKSSDVAQTVLHAVLRTFSAQHLLELDEASRDSSSAGETQATLLSEALRAGSGHKRQQQDNKPSSIGDLLEGLLPYTQRHFARADRALSQESFVLDYTLRQMDAGLALLVDEDVQEATDGDVIMTNGH